MFGVLPHPGSRLGIELPVLPLPTMPRFHRRRTLRSLLLPVNHKRND